MKLVAESHEVKGFIEDAVAQITDSRKHKGYLAKIVGTHPTYKLDRKFVDTYEVSGYKYSDIKEDGLYEFCTSKVNKDRYYLLVDNDVITEIDGEAVISVDGYQTKLLSLTPGDVAEVTIQRQGNDGYTEIKCPVTVSVLQ